MKGQLQESMLDETGKKTFHDVTIKGLDKDKTTYNMDLFQLYLVLSEIPEKFWTGCFEQAQIERYKSGQKFFIQYENNVVVTVGSGEAQGYIDELKIVLAKSNMLYKELIYEAKVEEKRHKAELAENQRRINQLHESLAL